MFEENCFACLARWGESLPSEKNEESFRVVDRRLFSEDGQLRKEVVEQERLEQEAVRKSPAAPGTSAGAQPAAGTSKAPAAPAPSETLQPSRQFEMLVDLLARNAAVFLGGYADPATGRPIVDLEGAREVIDMLEVLRDKTHGNLAAEDDHLLVEVLASLKMSYLEISKAAAQAMRENPTTLPPSKSRGKS